MTDSKPTTEPPDPVPVAPGRRRAGTARRYLVSAAIGFVLVFVSDSALRIWTHEGAEKAQEPSRVTRLSEINQRLINAPRAVRPWDVAGSFYRRITGSTYSPAVLSLTQPFRVDPRKADRMVLPKNVEDLKRENFNWRQLHPDLPPWSVAGSNGFGFLLGIPDGIIFTVRRVYSGGWLNIIVNILALLCALPVTLYLLGGRGKPGFVLLALPLVTSLCGWVLWAMMLVATRVCTFLLMPAAQLWAFVLPALITAVQHIPASFAHKGIEEHLEKRMH